MRREIHRYRQIATLMTLAACTTNGTINGRPAQGSAGGPCYGNGSCDVGLTCASDFCVRLSGYGEGEGEGEGE